MEQTNRMLAQFGALAKQQSAEKLLALNPQTAAYGLTLSPSQASALAETQAESLKKAGRIELGGHLCEQLVLAFCDSPYLDAASYEQTLHELVEGFYLFKNETFDVLSDKAVLCFMRDAFDHLCGGSTDQLFGTVLPELARHLTSGGTLGSYLEEKRREAQEDA